MMSAKFACMASAVTLASFIATTALAQTDGNTPKQETQPDQSEMMPGWKMGRMHPGMMMGGMGPGRGQMMKIIFAIADTDGDGALSFEEVTAVHKRIFDKIDANKDGKITVEEIQAFVND